MYLCILLVPKTENNNSWNGRTNVKLANKSLYDLSRQWGIGILSLSLIFYKTFMVPVVSFYNENIGAAGTDVMSVKFAHKN